jgi:CHAT domain-containing protein
VLTSTGQPKWIPLAKATEVNAMVQNYQRLVRDPSEENELLANLEELYRKLWTPIEQSLSHELKRAIISPDGQLTFVSFATLLDSENHFFAEK